MNKLSGPIKQSLGGTALLAGVALVGLGINASLFNGKFVITEKVI